ncbi:MAG: hypothetical protein JWQ55_227 [Rhodopila sp.]|nr:hypothetical protein [Rhodopila sp.]
MLTHRGLTEIIVVEARMNGSYAGGQENFHPVRLRDHPAALHRSPRSCFAAGLMSWSFSVLRVPRRTTLPMSNGEMIPVDATYAPQRERNEKHDMPA